MHTTIIASEENECIQAIHFTVKMLTVQPLIRRAVRVLTLLRMSEAVNLLLSIQFPMLSLTRLMA